MEMGHAHPMEISIRGFDASHLLQLSTNRFFRLNGKQPWPILSSTITLNQSARRNSDMYSYCNSVVYGSATGTPGVLLLILRR